MPGEKNYSNLQYNCQTKGTQVGMVRIKNRKNVKGGGKRESGEGGYVPSPYKRSTKSKQASYKEGKTEKLAWNTLGRMASPNEERAAVIKDASWETIPDISKRNRWDKKSNYKSNGKVPAVKIEVWVMSGNRMTRA